VARDALRGENRMTVAPASEFPADSTWQCALDRLPPPLVPDLPAAGGGLRSAGCMTVSVAVDSDYEFTQLFGGSSSAASAYVATLFGAINAIYQRDLGTTLLVSYVRVWPTDTDPWTQSSLEPLLYQFENYWETNMTAVPRQTAHLLSGKQLGGGIAFLYALCGYQPGYGVSANIRGTFPTPLVPGSGNWDVIVVAHEIGHNFGSPHTHCYNPPIDTCYSGECYVGPVALPAGGLGTLMSYCHTLSGGLANIDLKFHTRCQTQIQSFLTLLQDNAFCALNSLCGSTCAGADVNCDGAVNSGDLLAVRSIGTWGLSGASRADVNDDGMVDSGDLLAIRAVGTWGTATGACNCPP
jgi:hypothetical protein